MVGCATIPPTGTAYTQDLKAFLGWCQRYNLEVLRVAAASTGLLPDGGYSAFAPAVAERRPGVGFLKELMDGTLRSRSTA